MKKHKTCGECKWFMDSYDGLDDPGICTVDGVSFLLSKVVLPNDASCDKVDEKEYERCKTS